MQPLWGLTAGLSGLWIISLLYVELAAFWIPRWTCSWPDLSVTQQQQLHERPVRVVLIADPQLTDRTSYGMRPGSLVLKLVQFYSDIYMRRAFRSSVLGLEPDEIIFLGDHFDGGPHLLDYEWNDSLKRFQHIFDQSERGLKRRSNQLIPVRYLCGNHDLGYHEVFSRDPRILQRYREKFGETDYVHKVGGVEFVVVNAQALDGERSDASSNNSWSFIEHLGNTSASRILLTHIPLYRSDNTSCGAARASPVINQRLRRANWSPGRITYQDYLTNETSHKLLDRIRPVMIFSGHDHDQCSVNHSASSGGFYPEHTVGTFSWQQGNIYPSFMMLSVAPGSSNDPVVAAALCFLPVQDFNYAWYAVLLVITILALLFWPSQGIDLMPAIHVFYNAIKGSGSLKEKDEDAEWEMMWDAEGAMHLIRKLSTHSTSQTQSSERRGTAVQRAAARANASAAAEEAFDSDLVSLTSSSHKRMNYWRRRLYLVSGPFTVLLAANFSLYMMLMMKDWA